MSADSCVVITTINPPTTSVLKYIAEPNVDVIIVADKKTPAETYAGLDCIFLSVEDQQQTFPEFDALLPFNHYARKNMGYLYAITRGYQTIFETDDDNLPLAHWAQAALRPTAVQGAELFNVTGAKFVNIYQRYSDEHLWPRGLPLSRVLDDKDQIQATAAPEASNRYFDNVSILQGMADGDPDMDAIFRLVSKDSQKELIFPPSKAFHKLDKGHYCPGNTQNTTWFKPSDFALMYVPSYVSFRFCDILKMYIAQAFASHAGNSMVFQGATVYQDRNPHDFFQDFLQEVEMYVHVERLMEVVEGVLAKADAKSGHGPALLVLYQALVDENIVKDQREVELLRAWLEALK